MTDQPPVQPPHQPSGDPARQPGPGYPATQPMAAAAGDPAATPGVATGRPVAAQAGPNAWHQVTSTHGGRWAIAVAAAALVALMMLGVGVAGLLVLRNHDRFGMMGQRGDGFSRGQMGHRDGRDDGGNSGPDSRQPGVPRAPGLPGGGSQGLGGLGGLGGLLGGGALHGTVTATVNGTPQALVFQRGQVSAVSASSITLKSSDGFTGTYGRTSATSSMMAAPVTGGQAFVLARASDKVAITVMSIPAGGGVGPGN
jgi:hypothetical protein